MMLEAMASNLLAMASNLLAPTGDGLQLTSNGLQPRENLWQSIASSHVPTNLPGAESSDDTQAMLAMFVVQSCHFSHRITLHPTCVSIINIYV